MSWLRQLLGALFPYRRHLEEEINYLRGQVAQKQRRIDELQEALIEHQKLAPKLLKERLTPIRTQPLGWDAYRENQRHIPPEPEEEKPDGTQS